jgi:hypothetical protein
LINQTCIQDTGYIDECYCVFKTYNGTWLCSVEYTYVNYTDALNKYNDIDYDKLKVYGENNGVCKTEHTDYTYYYSLAYYLLAGGILSIFTCCITVYKYESMYQMHRRSMAEQEGMSP